MSKKESASTSRMKTRSSEKSDAVAHRTPDESDIHTVSSRNRATTSNAGKLGGQDDNTVTRGSRIQCDAIPYDDGNKFQSCEVSSDIDSIASNEDNPEGQNTAERARRVEELGDNGDNVVQRRRLRPQNIPRASQSPTSSKSPKRGKKH